MTDEFIGIFNHFYKLANSGLLFWWITLGPIPFVSIIILFTIVLNDLGHKNDRQPIQDEPSAFGNETKREGHPKSR
jgi:Trk-type K+ transport system membrane component